MNVSAFVEAKLAMPDDRGCPAGADLSPMGVARQRERYAVAHGLIKKVRMMRKQKMGTSVFAHQAGPIGLAENKIIDAADNKLAVAVG